MYSTAHKIFALGIASFFSFLLGIPLSTTIVICIVSVFFGVFPDIDMKIKGLKHRTITHEPMMIALVGFIITIALQYILFMVDQLLGFPFFYIHMVFYGSIPIPYILHAIFTLNIIGLFMNSLVVMNIAIFMAGISHIALDVVTPSGLFIGGTNVGGGFLSKSSHANNLFIYLGAVTTTFSFIGIIIRNFIPPIYILQYLLVYTLSFTASMVLIYFVAFYLLKKRRMESFKNQLECYKVRDNITDTYSEICTWKTTRKDDCFGYKGKKICNLKK